MEKLVLICTYKHAKAIGADQTVFFQDVYRRLMNSSPVLPEIGPIITNHEATRSLYMKMVVEKLARLGLLTIDHENRQRSHGPALALRFDFEDMRVVLEADRVLERIL